MYDDITLAELDALMAQDGSPLEPLDMEPTERPAGLIKASDGVWRQFGSR